jgi:acyl-CoA reductase-like NAD-dependent aldehyde dehydrogenase
MSNNPNKPPVPPAVQTLLKLGAKWRYVSHGPTLEKQDGEFVPVKPSSVTCEVFDEATGELYAKATASTPEEARDKAAEIAKKAPKPKTPAQKVEESLPLGDQIEIYEKKLAELRKKLPKEPKDKP